MFTSFVLEDKSGGAYSNAKLNLKKSRLGCQRCKARRVKCDEVKPKCKNCKRHGAQCVYLDPQPPSRKSRTSPDNKHDCAEYPKQPVNGFPKYSLDIEEPPESQKRRLLEVQLMSQYICKTADTLAVDDFSRSIFKEAALELCFHNNALLYAIYSLAASDQLRLGQDDANSSLNIHQIYLSMALRHHQNDLANINSENIDAICITSSMLRGYAFGLLQHRKLQPYKPPTEWLMFSRTTVALFTESYHVIASKPDSIGLKYLDNAMAFQPPKDQVGRQVKEFKYLLQREPVDIDTEPWSEEVREAYEWAILFFADVRAAWQGGMEEGQICRRLIIFPMIMPQRLVDLFHQREPRSLAVFAHYFAFLASFEHIWWIGPAGVQEVRAIAGELTGRWSRMIEWPIQVAEQRGDGRHTHVSGTAVRQMLF